MKIYVASSWRNERQPAVVVELRAAGHDVYDFRHPGLGDAGFAWSDIDPDWERWSPAEFLEALSHPIAQRAFTLDKSALDECDVCVLVMPCGRSAHLELGCVIGQGKSGIILLSEAEPELMYKLGSIATDMEQVLAIMEKGHVPRRISADGVDLDLLRKCAERDRRMELDAGPIPER